MKKILIAGATGFLGYHLAKFALKKKFKVYSISKNLPKKKKFLKKVKYLNFDLRKSKKILINNSFDYVINTAGYGKHFKSSNNKKIFEHLDILKNLINLINKNVIKKFIQIGTSLEYSRSSKKIKESFECYPTSLYGKAKLKCTNYLLFIHKNFNFPVTIFRVFQIYGPLQEENRLIPYVINSCKKNKKFALTKGDQVRNFCYIDDFVKLIFKSLDNKKVNGEIINIGHPESHSIKQVVNLIKKIIKKGSPIFGKKKTHQGETKVIVPNISKIKKLLNWEPKVNFLDGLKKII